MMSIRSILLILCAAGSTCAFSQDVRIAISSDYERSAQADSLFTAIVSEMDRTVGAARQITLLNEGIKYGNRSIEQALASYNELSPQADIILLIGSISTVGALQRTSLVKPTIAVGVVDPELQGLPYIDGTSGKDNFSYLWASQDIFTELEEFRRLLDFERMALLINASSATTIDNEKGRELLDSIKTAFSIEVDIIPVGNDPAAAVNSITDQVDAVFISELNGKSSADISIIADALKERKLPSYSSSQWHVELGILASVSEDNDFEQAIRRMALMVDEVVRGEPLSQMPVALNFKETYNLNIQTANEIGLSPPFDVLFTANLIDQDGGENPTYSVTEILDLSLQRNLDVKLVNKDLELTEQDIALARSSMLPELGLSLSASQINPDQANNFNPERQTQAQLALSQVIFSEQAIASIRIAKYLREAQNYQTQSEILNILLDTYVLYFNVLAAKTDLIIQRQNLDNSILNLEIARTKVSTGASSSADIFRWESEVANGRQAVVQSETAVIAAKLELNTLLANGLEDNFDIEDVTIDGEIFENLRNYEIGRLMKRPSDFVRLSNFLVQESLMENPNKRSLLENMRALERAQLQNQRLLYTPVVALQAQGGYVLDRSGAGSTEANGFEFVDYPWQLGLSLSYPVFQGNSRRANLQRSTIEVEQINFSRTQLDQNLELLTRTNLLNALSASTNIEFSQIAADNASNNFDLVRRNYQQGAASITMLIDAQNASLNAQLNNALSIYNYIVATLQVEFAVGFFSMLAPEDRLQDFQDRFEQYLDNN